MLGFYPGLYWRVCWVCCPFFIAVSFERTHILLPRIQFQLIFALALYETNFQPLEIPHYVYPWWSVHVGWVLRMLSVLSVPGYMLFMLATTRGSLLQRLKIMMKPQQRHASMNSTCPSIAIMDDKVVVIEEPEMNHRTIRRPSTIQGSNVVAHL
jgi:hypothetical protein